MEKILLFWIFSFLRLIEGFYVRLRILTHLIDIQNFILSNLNSWNLLIIAFVLVVENLTILIKSLIVIALICFIIFICCLPLLFCDSKHISWRNQRSNPSCSWQLRLMLNQRLSICLIFMVYNTWFLRIIMSTMFVIILKLIYNLWMFFLPY